MMGAGAPPSASRALHVASSVACCIERCILHRALHVASCVACCVASCVACCIVRCTLQRPRIPQCGVLGTAEAVAVRPTLRVVARALCADHRLLHHCDRLQCEPKLTLKGRQAVRHRLRCVVLASPRGLAWRGRTAADGAAPAILPPPHAQQRASGKLCVAPLVHSNPPPTRPPAHLKRQFAQSV